MRYPEGHKQQVRARIVATTAEAIRQEGIDGPSIPTLMERAGLTHGGFYAHFRDRDELIAAAVTAAADQTAERAFADDRTLEDVLDAYLSPGHVADPSAGCVVASLGTDAPRQSASVRAGFVAAAKGILTMLERKLHPQRPDPGFHDDALVHASTMIGAVVLARLVEDPSLRDRILTSAREHLAG
ncbi:MAG: TetR/AcrR family transcriptional regulator [Nitriliruptoraceae bacterium]|nr:TetR/AcrR family transcriptional regulator [Nitriliruptoraceae bacterium]